MSEDTSSELSRLEEEGELAADYLEELLDIADLDGDIESMSKMAAHWLRSFPRTPLLLTTSLARTVKSLMRFKN